MEMTRVTRRSACASQIVELRLGALASTRIDHHIDVVNELGSRERIVRVNLLGKDALDQQ